MTEELDLGGLKPLYMSAIFAVYVIVLAISVSRTWDFVNHREDRAMRQYVDNVFRVAGENALILSDWSSYPGLLYAQLVDHQRNDIVLYSVHSGGWRDMLPEIKAKHSQEILFSLELPGDIPRSGEVISNVYYLSIKGKTYQNYDHHPLPVAVQLFRIRNIETE